MSTTADSLREALAADQLLAVSPISAFSRPVGIGWAMLAPGHRPLIEARWFTHERQGVLSARIVRLERLAREATETAGLALRSETTLPRRAYTEFAERAAGQILFGDDLARRIDELAGATLAVGLPLRARGLLDLQDAVELLVENGTLILPGGASLAAINAAAARPIAREPFDSSLGRLTATVIAWHDLLVPAAARATRALEQISLAPASID